MNVPKLKQTESIDLTGILFEEKFVEQLVYEWIRRKRVYSDFDLTDLNIQYAATQFKNALNMTWFLPDKQWVKKFRTNFKIPQTKITKHTIAGSLVPKSLLHLDIIRDLFVKQKSKIGTRIKPSPGIEIVVIDDDIKEECPHQPSIFDKIEIIRPDKTEDICATSSESPPMMAQLKVVDFENVLPGIVVRNLNNPTLPVDVKNKDVENDIPIVVCTPEKVQVNTTADRMENVIYSDDHDMKTEMMPKQTEGVLQNGSVPTLKIAEVVSLHRSNQVLVKRATKRKSLLTERLGVEKSLLTERLGVEKSSNVLKIGDTPQAVNAPITPIKPTISVASTQEVAVLKKPSPITCALQLPSTIKITKLTPSTQSRPKTKFSERKPLRTRTEALKCIKLMEEFAMMKENFRLIGFIDRLEKLIKKTD